ncbi:MULTISPECIES: DUF423 domain-containing protein [Methylomonas]|uniref:DUF423 domain-containing protein n=1 Tax=Methylomonas TaxID=416 RepID=UPI001232A2FE|nr:DUF423 domain-containing protein [Methylomonas rhizoryzae]
MQTRFLFWAAIAGGSGVGLGAFGAHGLKSALSAYELEIYKTAVDYQMWHALLLGLIGSLPPRRQLLWAGWALLAGIVLFSGSLYLLAILKIRWLGVITPFGGTAFLAAWGLLAYAAYRRSEE